MKLNLLLLLVTILIYQAQSMKVLISMTFGSRSHIKNVFEIGKVLQERGDQVAYMSLKPMLRFADGYNVTKFQVGPDDIQIDDLRGISELNQTPVNPLADTVNALVDGLPIVFRTTFEDTLSVIDEYKPDVMICDFFSSSCIEAAYHRHIPLIVGFQTLDGPYVPPPYITGTLSYFPTTLANLSFGQRFYSTVIHPLTVLPSFLALNYRLNVERARYNLPTTVVTNVGNWENALKLCNTFMGFEGARPLDPSFKLVGPIMSEEHAPLSDGLKQFLDKRQKVVYIAFGSGVQLSSKDVNIIFNSVKKLVEYQNADGIIWALGKTQKATFNQTDINITHNGINLTAEDLLNNAHPNIKFLNWAPQVAILNHENTKLFISHGGLESAFESMYSGTPILTIPFFGDQYRNARKVEEMGFGGYSDRFTQTSISLYNKIGEMLVDKDQSRANAMQKWQLIAKTNSKKKYEAADIIQEYVALSKAANWNIFFPFINQLIL
ncbi:UDP-Glycosyltransferase/glycogen phosphorylase [Neoconidiobolus thromboides FSU 785]|nr:UDP-Glycosyltransferase/glycogen phosphorylase [Neoconidiobolus thromboides FSU 785]